MNFIKQLQADNRELQARLDATHAAITEAMSYLMSNKFHGVDSDFVNVSNDIMPKLLKIRQHTVEDIGRPLSRPVDLAGRTTR
tara:strand:- start:705 stop:953 length:249 start_codon:yes stop_codon:yes gene_type:complete